MAPRRTPSLGARLVSSALSGVPEGLYRSRPALPPGSTADLSLRYLGTAGFVLTGAQRTVVIDPYVSRPGLRATGFAPLVPDAALISELIPVADEVLVGHSHHDHVLDAPKLCEQTGARFIGSVDACNVARAAGLPEGQLVQTEGREDIACGSGTVRALPAAHGRVYFNRVTLPGRISEPPSWPPRVRDLRHGQVFNWLVDLGGVRVVHIDSAEFFREELQAVADTGGADVVCLCAIGRAWRPHYVAECVELLRPRVIVACHWDWFFTPWGAPPRLLPGVDLPGFIGEIEAAGVEPVVLPFGGELGLQAEELRAGRDQSRG